MQAAVTKREYSLGYRKAFVTGGSGFVGGALIQTLVANGVHVMAIARSSTAEQTVAAHGASPVRCDLHDTELLKEAMAGSEVVFHCAALTELTRPWADFEDVIVEGTRRVLQAALDSGVRRVVNVSSEAAMVTGFGSPLVDVDEEVPLPDPDTQAHIFYSRAKNMAELICMEFAPKVHVVTVRPRFIWGLGDTVVMRHLVEQATSALGFAWIGGAEYLTSTANISNVIHGMVLASESGTSGAAYFISDGEDLTVKEMFTQLFSTQGVDASNFMYLPYPIARFIAWTGLVPDVSAQTMALMAQQVTVRCTRAHADLNYSPIVTVQQGMDEVRVAFDSASQ